MPIKINADLPAVNTLEQENIFVMTEQRAETQEIRPLKVAIVNLMPTREVTEVQLLRLLGNTPLQIEISLIRMENHKYKHTGKTGSHPPISARADEQDDYNRRTSRTASL